VSVAEGDELNQEGYDQYPLDDFDQHVPGYSGPGSACRVSGDSRRDRLPHLGARRVRGKI